MAFVSCSRRLSEGGSTCYCSKVLRGCWLESGGAEDDKRKALGIRCGSWELKGQPIKSLKRLLDMRRDASIVPP